jgi:hypothetical protein
VTFRAAKRIRRQGWWQPETVTVLVPPASASTTKVRVVHRGMLPVTMGSSEGLADLDEADP